MFYRVAVHLTFLCTCFIVYSDKSLSRARPNLRVPDTSFIKFALPLLPSCVACLIKMRGIGPKSGVGFFLGPVPYFNEKIQVAANLFRTSPTAVDEQQG